MKHFMLSLVIIFILPLLLFAQPYNVSIEQVEDWNGWQALVVGNGLITTATVPAIGARVMQFDLGDQQSMFRDAFFNGKTFTPAASSSWYNFGGFKNWPSPQYGAGRWSWPPPPTLDFGAYTSEILQNTADSTVIRVTSPIEKWKAPNMQFVREMTVYKNSSHVKMKQILINQGSSTQNWGIWDNTQALVNHADEKDYENFWAYFSINPESVFGETGVTTQNHSPAWVGEVAPGIYGTQFTPNAAKLFADPDKGWLCYVDEREGVTFAKTFPVFEGKHYPDDEARIAVYMGVNYEEIEVMGPVEDIPPDGGQIEFTIDWWAARVHGPILDVNFAGAIAQKASYENGKLAGKYGVFHIGTAQAFILGPGGSELLSGNTHSVTPLAEFALAEDLQIPGDAEMIEIRVFSEEGDVIGILDKVDLSGGTLVNENKNVKPDQISLAQNYPNPFNPSTNITFTISNLSYTTLTIFNPDGKYIATLVKEQLSPGLYSITWDAADLASGVYFAQLKTGNGVKTVKMMLLH